MDTSYVLALFNTRDQWHSKAVQWQQNTANTKKVLMTSEFVLTEIGDGLSPISLRLSGGKVIRTLRESSLVEVIPASSEWFNQGLELFETRTDKAWGLTDCTSFAIMREYGLTDALTTDDHFRQAGFNALLID
ncbi:MAG: PIN domain-containing protein [Pyrinomonadaceae bacterium]